MTAHPHMPARQRVQYDDLEWLGGYISHLPPERWIDAAIMAICESVAAWITFRETDDGSLNKHRYLQSHIFYLMDRDGIPRGLSTAPDHKILAAISTAFDAAARVALMSDDEVLAMVERRAAA